jgi:hypothetical protein
MVEVAGGQQSAVWTEGDAVNKACLAFHGSEIFAARSGGQLRTIADASSYIVKPFI